MILVKDSAPDPSSLGATNGLAQFAMVCLPRLAHAHTLDTERTPRTIHPVLRPCIQPGIHEQHLRLLRRLRRVLAHALLLGPRHGVRLLRRYLVLTQDCTRHAGLPAPAQIIVAAIDYHHNGIHAAERSWYSGQISWVARDVAHVHSSALTLLVTSLGPGRASLDLQSVRLHSVPLVTTVLMHTHTCDVQ